MTEQNSRIIKVRRGILLSMGVIFIIEITISIYVWLVSYQGYSPFFPVIFGLLLLIFEILLALVGVVVSFMIIRKFKNLSGSNVVKNSYYCVVLFIVSPFIDWYINALILDAAIRKANFF